jgi:hypothetical protein
LTVPPLLTTVATTVPPEEMVSAPPTERTAPLAWPPDEMISCPPLDTVVPLAMPPDDTASTPPLLTTVPSASPFDSTTALPAFRSTVPLQLAPEVTEATAPLDTVVASALPPNDTVSVPPLSSVAPLAAPPDESQLIFVSRAAFTKCLQDHPEIYAYLVSALVARLRQADEEAAAASFLTGKARIARALLNLAQHLGKGESPSRIEIPHKIRQGDIAAMAGVARESVSRTLGEWRRRNVITTKSRYLVVNTTTLQREVDAGD